MTSLVTESQIAKRLQSCGIENAHLEARWILEARKPEEEVLKLVERRCHGEPLAYILQEKGFYKDLFFVKPGVLIPRPETELLVELSLQFVKESSLKAPLLLDFGCGSGCIGLSLLRELPEAKLMGFDLSEVAIEVSNENASRLGVADRVDYRQLSVTNLVDHISARANLIVANPPYIAENDSQVERHVDEYEPGLALYSGPTGLEKIESWSAVAFDLLESGGGFAMEFGKGQEEKVESCLKSLGFCEVSIHRDLAGIFRAVFARKK